MKKQSRQTKRDPILFIEYTHLNFNLQVSRAYLPPVRTILIAAKPEINKYCDKGSNFPRWMAAVDSVSPPTTIRGFVPTLSFLKGQTRGLDKDTFYHSTPWEHF